MTSVVWTMLSRLVLRMPALAGVILVSFALTRLLPGDPAVYFAGAAPTPEAIADLRRTLLLDQPLYARLWGSGFLDSKYQGVQFRSGNDPVLYLSNPDGICCSGRHAMLICHR